MVWVMGLFAGVLVDLEEGVAQIQPRQPGGKAERHAGPLAAEEVAQHPKAAWHPGNVLEQAAGRVAVSLQDGRGHADVALPGQPRQPPDLAEFVGGVEPLAQVAVTERVFDRGFGHGGFRL